MTGGLTAKELCGHALKPYIRDMDVVMVLVLVVLIVAGVVLMVRSDSPTWFLWPWGRVHWVILVIAAVLWALMLTLY